jgi:HK97 family phage major capsid protein
MAGRIEGILRAMERTPWAIQEAKLEEILAFLDLRVRGQLSEAEIKAATARRKDPEMRQHGAVAVLPLYGVISYRMNMLSAMSGGTSAENFGRDFMALVKNPDVAAIVLDVDSPGGAVQGVQELAQLIFDARGEKPCIAVCNPTMASAAYWIASAADEIVAIPSATDIGSIGVYAVHTDISKADAEAGVTRSIVKAGKFKAEGTPYEPLSKEARAALQEKIDDTYAQFLADVARNRGVSVGEVEANYGQGRTLAAQRALGAGMVDRIATLDDVLEELVGGSGSAAMPMPMDRQRRADVLPIRQTAALDEFVETEFVAARIAAAAEAVGVTQDEVAAVAAVIEQASVDAGGDAPAANTDPPAPEPAPTGQREEPMAETMVAPTGAATLDFAEERKRVRQISALAREHSITDQAKVDGWIESGASVSDVETAILRQRYREEQARGSDVQVRVGEDREAAKPFASLGEQLLAIKGAEAAGASPDSRLLRLNAAATGAGTVVPSDGGFLVQQDFAAGILQRAYQLGEISSRVRRIPIGADKGGLKINAVDEASRVTGSRYGGIQVYWEAEGNDPTAKKPKFRQMELNLRKLIGAMYATDEILQDATALGAVAQQGFAEEINFMVEDAFFRGDGVGKPLGIHEAACLVSVAKESGQTADTIVTANVLKMYARLWARSRKTAAWFVSQDAEPQLYQLTLGSGTAVVLLYTPPGVNNSQYGRMLGLPVIPVEYADTVGNAGDITLADFDQYLSIDKGGVNTAWSIHIRFLQDEQVFRITYRVDGQPIWNKPLTPFKGANTQSPFITLDAR